MRLALTYHSVSHVLNSLTYIQFVKLNLHNYISIIIGLY